jgi:hypothetical protein
MEFVCHPCRLKPASETQNPLKRVGNCRLNVLQHVFCLSLGIHSQVNKANLELVAVKRDQKKSRFTFHA